MSDILYYKIMICNLTISLIAMTYFAVKTHKNYIKALKANFFYSIKEPLPKEADDFKVCNDCFAVYERELKKCLYCGNEGVVK